MPVTRLVSRNGHPKLTDREIIAKASQVAKAQSDLGVVGEAMSSSAINTAIGSPGRAWQQKLLADAAIYWWLYKKNPWVRTCVDLIAQRATADDYAIESATDDETGVRSEE